MHLLDRIDQWGKSFPEHPAHLSGDRVLTYEMLRTKSDALAARLHRELAGTPGPIAVLGHKEPEMLVAFLASVKAGRPYVPIDLSIPLQRAEKIIATSGAARVLRPAEIAAMELNPEPPPSVRVEAADPFYILFTSGSTGEPKGVVITLANLETFLSWMTHEQKFAPQGEVFLNQAPFSFDLSVMDLYLSLSTGGTLFSVTKDDVASLKSLYLTLGRSRVTSWVSTPSFAQMCLIERSFGREMLPSLRRFLFCGETLAPETASQLIERFPEAEVWNTYGPTEATVATTSILVDREVLATHSPLPVGRPMPGTQLLVLGDDGLPVPEGDRGEINIVGPNVSPGYLARPDLTSKVFYERDGLGAYRTGDWGREKQGLIFFEGRMDGQIKLHGYRIELGDLEANLRALPDVADALVLPVQKAGKVDALMAFIVPASPVEGSDFEFSSRLKTALGQRVPAYMVPRKFRFLEAFPMTPNGKADRRKLAELMESSR
jgi:D-alanine--poly(phosphoribitol) ligase subunit 1